MAEYLKEKYQVVVAGGGTAGIVAAIGAARAGASTLLIEQAGFVGGVAAMGIPFHGFFNNREEQILGGIPWEIFSRLKAMNAAGEVRNMGMGEPRGKGSSKFNARFVAYHPEAFKYLALEMLREAGVDLLLHTYVSDVVLDGRGIAGLVVENKSGRTIIPASQVVDCSGDGDVAAMAGAQYLKGSSESGDMQPTTMLFVMSNIDITAAEKGTAIKYPYEIVGSDFWRTRCQCHSVKMGRWAAELQQEMPDYASLIEAFNVWTLGDGVHYCGNMLHIPKLDVSQGDQLSQAEIDGRRLTWQLGQFLRRHLPGFERSHIVSTAAQIGIRETRRIVGEYEINYDDVVDGRSFDDVVAMCGYRVDIHGFDGGQVYYEPAKGTQVKDYGSYDIPYRSLVPLKVDNVLVAGRCISSTQEAQGSCRVMGTSMATGQAAGVAAALSAQEGVAPRSLEYRLLERELRRQGAMLEPLAEATEASPPLAG
jgi:hypothetical protein